MTSLRLFLRSSYPIERMLALTDGVYAIVLTLLVLDLKVPEVSGPTNTDLRTDLIAQIPNFIAYLVSFVLVAFFWMNHERLFAVTKRCDERMMVVNAVHLLMVSLVPYTASLIGHYEGDRIAAMMFCANMGLASSPWCCCIGRSMRIPNGSATNSKGIGSRCRGPSRTSARSSES